MLMKVQAMVHTGVLEQYTSGTTYNLSKEGFSFLSLAILLDNDTTTYQTPLGHPSSQYRIIIPTFDPKPTT